MKEITIAVCDDVLEDADTLKQLIHETLPAAEIRTYASGEALLKIVEERGNPFHAIFLDIHMSGLNGIETTEKIRKWDKTVPVIFVSCSDHYYREAFDVYAYQYILKPIDKDALNHVLKRLMELWYEEDEPTLHFRYRAQTYTLRHSQIRYISSNLHTVSFHLTDGRSIHCRGKLNDFTEQLEGSNFVRCHQSFFVNMDAVTGMKADSFLLDELIIPISRSFSGKVQEQYSGYLQSKNI